MMASLFAVKQMVEEELSTLTEITTKVNGAKIKFTDLEFNKLKTGVLMRVIGPMISKTGSEKKLGQMVQLTRETT